jgi:hypothetical protein
MVYKFKIYGIRIEFSQSNLYKNPSDRNIYFSQRQYNKIRQKQKTGFGLKI